MSFETIRKALKSYRDFFDPGDEYCTCDPEVGYMCEGCARRKEATDALTALTSIDPDAIRAEARAEALREAAKAISTMNQMSPTAIGDDYLIGYGFGVRDCQIKLESILAD